jgi:hypothetical protein
MNPVTEAFLNFYIGAGILAFVFAVFGIYVKRHR